MERIEIQQDRGDVEEVGNIGDVNDVGPGLPPVAWTRRQGVYPRNRGAHEVFLDIALRHGGRPAIRTETGEMDYRELDRRANQLAQFLISRGVAAGDRVGLLFERSPELIIAQLATLKVGGVYVPIDPQAPPERVAFFVRDAGFSLLLCAGEAPALPDAPALRILSLGKEGAAIAQASAVNPGRSRQGGDPAYVMYTSGSSGVPKGVEIPHRAIVRLVCSQDYFPAGPEQCTLLLGSPGFDGTTYEIWSALLHGACCAVFPDRWMDHQRLEHVIRTLGVTCLSISTGLFNQIIDRQPHLFETTRHVMVVGEALSVPHIRRAMAAMPHVRFGNGYGPTECTTFTCAWVIEDPATWGCASVPLGIPINHTECHIVDADLRPVPIGVAGELLVGGDGLALRYVNRPELTEQRFIRHPFSDDPQARLYRTGDRCFWLPNGLIAYVGREDDQVKLRGYRIELAEVEAALRRCAGIENAAVVVHTFPSGARGLVGGVVVAAAHPWNEEGTRAELERLLPDAMVPSRLFRAEHLPLTQNGKVDRRALAGIVQDRLAAEIAAPAGSSKAALTDGVRQLLTVWKTVLRDGSLDADSDFFRCGGDSLLAVEVATEVQRRWGREVPVGTLYRFSTPRQLAAWLEDSRTPDAELATADPVALVGDGPGSPVFFVPGADGYGLVPKAMAEALAGRHPYFDRLTYSAVSNRTDPTVSVEQIAAGLIPQMRQVCPHGPYIVVGFSFGGLVAYELARQLLEAGETVEHVILWDAYPLIGFERRSLLSSAGQAIRLAFSASRWRDRDWLQHKLSGLRRRFSALGDRLIGAATHDPARQAAPISSAIPTAGSFRPQAYRGRVSVLACLEEDETWVFERYLVDRNGWAALVPADRLAIFPFPCGHLDALKPPHLDSFVQKTLELIDS
ncbi:MAG TPA: amino acid adenylation domain-containing protein [Bryobacteraceae bacterium]|jgi:amino acid adenylation domain-containing protein